MEDKKKILLDKIIDCESMIPAGAVAFIVSKTLDFLSKNAPVFQVAKDKLSYSEYNNMMNNILFSILPSIYATSGETDEIKNARAEEIKELLDECKVEYAEVIKKNKMYN